MALLVSLDLHFFGYLDVQCKVKKLIDSYGLIMFGRVFVSPIFFHRDRFKNLQYWDKK